MPIYTWEIEFDAVKHVVRAEVPFVTGGMWRLSFDQEVLVETRLMSWEYFFSRSFVRGGHEFKLGYNWGLPTYKPTLHVDGVLVNRDVLSVIPPRNTDSSAGKPSSADATVTKPDSAGPSVAQPASDYQLVGEDIVREDTEVIATEEYPLDNRAGAESVTIEHEISRTVSNEMTIGNSTQKDGGISLELANLIKGNLSAKVRKQTGQTLGETVTRRHSIRFSAGPHQVVTYVVVWRRRVLTGNYLVLNNGTYTTVPYTAYFDLSFEVQSR